MDAAALLSTSRYQTDFDVGLPALVELLQVMRRFWDDVIAARPDMSPVQVVSSVPSPTSIYQNHY